MKYGGFSKAAHSIAASRGDRVNGAIQREENMSITLREITEWLRTIEDLACSVYAEAAASDAVSPDVADFLNRLSRDEAQHYHLMGSAIELMRIQNKDLPSAVDVDSATRERVEKPLRDLHVSLERGDVTERHILEEILAVETLEWNDIFLYVINYCSELSIAFQHIAAIIQAHEKRLETFFAKKDAYADLVAKLFSLPQIWQKRLLVVEDDAPVRSLLAHALARYGTVTAVEDGEEALSRIRDSFFDVVVTDVDMPVRNGISLLLAAVDENKLWRSHFIVCTGNATEEVCKVTKENGVPLLQKPFSIDQLWMTVEKVLTVAQQ